MLKKLLVTLCLGSALNLTAQVIPTTIAYLHTLEDSTNYVLTDATNVYSVTGTVTTHANLTSASGSLFYVQDNTGGIAVYIGGTTAPRPSAGDNVTVTGGLFQFNGLLEISTGVTIVTNSTGNPLPAPATLSFNLTPAQYEAMESSYFVVSNVFVDQSAANFPASGVITITNKSGETFAMYVNGYTDIPNSPRPLGPTTIYGVLGQFDSTDPKDSGYQLIPSRAADIVPLNPPPLVSFTNTLSNLVRPGDAVTSTTFTEYALRPGETLTIDTASYDTDGRTVTINPSTTTPSGVWSYASATGTNVPATFAYTASPGDAGNAYTVTMQARTSLGTNTTVWSIYVPTAEEQNIVISEFLANPTTDTNSPYFNPLHRPKPGSTNAYADDEFIELVNANDTSFDFIGWSFYDAVSFRHQFYNPTSVGPSNTVVLYGGRLNADPAAPSIPGASAPFSEAQVGVSVLNDGGDTIRLYNLDGHLVDRVVYTSATSANGISWTRYPTLTNDFVEHASVVCTNASPGLQPDQRSYDLPVIISQPPTISGIADQTISQDASTGPIAFTVSDPVTPAANLTLIGYPSNPTIVPYGNIVFGGSGSNRTVTVTPAAGQSGVAYITVTVGNANLRCASTNFLLTVSATNSPVSLFCDDFSYPDGSIITNSGFMWTNHSGTVGQMQVSGGKLQVTFAQSEDVNRLIPGQPYGSASGLTLYAGFTVNFSELPSSSGGYFAHFKDGSFGYAARLWAGTANAGSGQFRLSIANGTGTPAEFPQDLSLNTTYGVVIGYNLTSGQSTLWVDPANEASMSAQDTSAATPITVAAFALRQSGGIGTMEIDDLCVGTGFASVIPAVPPSAIPITIAPEGNNLVLSWSNPGFTLLTGTNITEVTNVVVNAQSPYTNSFTDPTRYFRLIMQ